MTTEELIRTLTKAIEAEDKITTKMLMVYAKERLAEYLELTDQL